MGVSQRSQPRSIPRMNVAIASGRLRLHPRPHCAVCTFASLLSTCIMHRYFVLARERPHWGGDERMGSTTRDLQTPTPRLPTLANSPPAEVPFLIRYQQLEIN